MAIGVTWQLGSNLQKSFDKMLSLGKIRGQIFMERTESVERTESGLHIIQPLVCKEKGGQIFIVDKTVSNRLTDIQQRSYTYNNGNELLNYDGVSFQYDANGNIVSKTDSSGTTSYVYDSENRLAQLTTPNLQLVTYKYDPFGRRIEKNVNGVITRYVYDREDIIFELDGSGNIVTEYVHGPGIDEPIAMIRNNQTYYYHADGLGSIIAITGTKWGQTFKNHLTKCCL